MAEMDLKRTFIIALVICAGAGLLAFIGSNSSSPGGAQDANSDSGPSYSQLINSQSIKGGYLACTSRDYYNQMMDAVSRHDKMAENYLINNMYCFSTPNGSPISVLDVSLWTGIAKVRLYSPDGAAADVVWVQNEALSMNAPASLK